MYTIKYSRRLPIGKILLIPPPPCIILQKKDEYRTLIRKKTALSFATADAFALFSAASDLKLVETRAKRGSNGT